MMESFTFTPTSSDTATLDMIMTSEGTLRYLSELRKLGIDIDELVPDHNFEELSQILNMRNDNSP
jgi:hypothetical protein